MERPEPDRGDHDGPLAVAGRQGRRGPSIPFPVRVIHFFSPAWHRGTCLFLRGAYFSGAVCADLTLKKRVPLSRRRNEHKRSECTVAEGRASCSKRGKSKAASAACNFCIRPLRTAAAASGRNTARHELQSFRAKNSLIKVNVPYNYRGTLIGARCMEHMLELNHLIHSFVGVAGALEF